MSGYWTHPLHGMVAVLGEIAEREMERQGVPPFERYSMSFRFGPGATSVRRQVRRQWRRREHLRRKARQRWAMLMPEQRAAQEQIAEDMVKTVMRDVGRACLTALSERC